MSFLIVCILGDSFCVSVNFFFPFPFPLLVPVFGCSENVKKK